MNENHHNMDSDIMAPAVAQQTYDANVDYVINEYMERLGTRLNILETELKYAWRALDLLSQEYIKMWERLEKLEGLLYEQQSVISQLLDFYTSGGNSGPATGMGQAAMMLEGRLGELEVIREILGNGTVEDGLEEGLDVTITEDTSVAELQLEDEMHIPDEAFYKSLNQAYREDLVGCDPSINQLGMIWEEREELEDNGDKQNDKDIESMIRKDSDEEIYSALDYKDYRGNSPCISEQDLAQLTRIDSIDQVAIEKLSELDRLSSKLHQDSVNIKQLQRKLMESPISVGDIQEEQIAKANIEENLQKIFSEEKWSFTNDVKDQEDLLLLAKSDLPNMLSNTAYSTRPNSRLSVTDTDNEVAETLAGGIRTPTSPRRKQQKDIVSCNAPFTTVTGRLAYSNAVQHIEAAENAAANFALQNSKNPFINYDTSSLISVPFETVSCSTPSIFSVKSEKAVSPTLSICSIRTRQDGYIDRRVPPTSPSPPPPAPTDISEPFVMVNQADYSTSSGFLGSAPSTSIMSDHGRLSPKTHSPRSPKTSPRRSKSHTSNIVAAKSDSGLSSMSGWSSLEKSPGSPKNGKYALNFYSEKQAFTNVPVSPRVVHPDPTQSNTKPFTETLVDSKLSPTSASCFLPGGHHMSAFTTVKSPSGLDAQEGYGTFVPAPAPVSDINVSPNKRSDKKEVPNDYRVSQKLMYRTDQPAIYSVAGCNRESYTSVYTSNSADYINQTIHYPDLVEPYENNEFYNAHQRNYYNSLLSTPYSAPSSSHSPQPRRRSLSRSHSVGKSDGITNHEGYKTAMHRTMFPSGNITDALSYYPTSSRYDTSMGHPPQNYYSDPSGWTMNPEGQFLDSSTTSSSVRSAETTDTNYTQSPYLDRRQHSQMTNSQQQPIYENQQQIEQQRQWSQRQEIPYLELDLRNRNLPEYVVQQQHGQNLYYDTSGVIMTQSGYITISSGAEQPPREEKQKKLKRGNTLKSAMNSVSHWLPDLHLPKRNRSYSLPGIKKEEHKSSSIKKKKKNGIVSTVSGIIQKAKRKGSHHQHYSQSLSDPEQSENEWTVNRTRSVVSEDDKSEDSSSVFSENQFDKDIFPKLIDNKQKRPQTQQPPPVIEPKSVEEEFPLQPVFETMPHITEKPAKEQDEKTESSTEQKDLEELDTKTMFPTIGETKRNSLSLDKEDSISSENKMVVVVGGASMEFAVSRALGKYRQRQTNSLSDDQICNEDHGVVVEDVLEETNIQELQINPAKVLSEQRSTDSQNSIENSKPFIDDSAVSEGSPSTISLRSHTNRFLPKPQQSLDIPGGREDDDCRSTHSWRSTSRVSSRRQSTEDSIDSEDEWYCYELRKLEEMERQTVLEQEMGATLLEEPEPPEEEPFEPDEEVKEKMSFVLRELRMKAKPIENVLEEKENNLITIQAAKRRKSNRGSFQLDSASSLFAKVKNYHHDEFQQAPDVIAEDMLAVPGRKDDEEHSSGDTSGPDSPRHSADEYDETEMVLNDEFSKCHIQPDEPVQKTESVALIPQIHVEPSVAPLPEEAQDEPPKEGAQMGSKWKLLKTLKERKAEERNHGKVVPEPSDKVSMLGMVQKFYEIHVKT